jgi:hypothetical protein
LTHPLKYIRAKQRRRYGSSKAESGGDASDSGNDSANSS